MPWDMALHGGCFRMSQVHRFGLRHFRRDRFAGGAHPAGAGALCRFSFLLKGIGSITKGARCFLMSTI
ncbi:hypothetical protein DQW77_14470 [Roseovarius sp. TE539]|nr:hypothetical protein DQW77_14470 [Roseovarius sp. TE539]